MGALLRVPPALWLLLGLAAVLTALILEPGRLTPPPAPVARSFKLPDGSPDTYAEALARADQEVADYVDRAASAPGQWLVLEALARRQATKARLTGEFADYAAARTTLAQAFAVAEPGAGPHLARAVQAFTMHRLAAAEADLDAIDRYAVAPDLAERAEGAALRGDIAFYRGDYATAMRRYREADRLEPGSGTAFRYAVYYSKLGDPDRAEGYFDRALKASRMATPQFRAHIELQKGTLDLERGRWDAALAHFLRADAIFPGHWLIEEHIAETLALQGRTAEAERLYADIVRRTGHPEFMDALAGVLRARGDTGASDAWTARARAAWEARLRLFPEAAYGHALDHFLASGDTARALEIARLNHAARPYGDAKVMLAQALLQAGDRQAARAMIEEVLRSPWRTAQTHGVAAQVYAALGQDNVAARQRRMALAINPHELDDAAPLKAAD